MIILSKVKIEKIKVWCAAGAIVLTIVELFPSVRYGYKIFFPIWNVAIYQNGIGYESRAGGTLGPIYFDKIIKYCEKSGILLDDIKIIDSYKSKLPKYYYNIPYMCNAESSKPDCMITEEMLNENSFYCIDNYSVENDLVQFGNGYISIKDAEPISEVKYRGLVISRIYRGDQLQFETFR